MKRLAFLSALFLGIGTASAATQGKATINDAEGKKVGEATLTQTPSGVLIKAQFENLPPGVHGFHFHEKGACAPNFDAAGAHFNPSKKKHGFQAPKGEHAGDLPNLHVPENGKLTVEVLAPDVKLEGGKTSLLADNGTSLMVHAGPDDYKTDPSGDSGGRIACGVIEKAGAK